MIGKECYAEINSTLDALLAEKKVLVAVHRGAWGGNIVENTIPSCRLCREMGGDIFECDVASSTDGVLYAFHDGTERRNLNRSDNIKTMSSQEVDSLVYNNCIYEPSGVHVERFEDIVRYFCHGEIFNIDRAWDILPQLTAALDKYPHALKQAIIKTHVVPEQLQFLNDYPTKYMYMPIVYNMDEVRQVLSYPTLNVVGMEIITDSKDNDIFQDENIRFIRDQNLYVWANVIKLGTLDKHVLFAGLDDDVALLDDPDKAWGEAIRKGANVLQTDWPLQLSRFRDQYCAK